MLTVLTQRPAFLSGNWDKCLLRRAIADCDVYRSSTKDVKDFWDNLTIVSGSILQGNSFSSAPRKILPHRTL